MIPCIGDIQSGRGLSTDYADFTDLKRLHFAVRHTSNPGIVSGEQGENGPKFDDR